MAAPAHDDVVPILIELHNKYLKSNPVAVEAVQPYTGHDHKMASVMNFLRSNTVDNCVTLLNAFRNDKDKIQKYASNFQNTILNAPTINSQIVLFRGLNIKLGEVGNTWTDKSFTGTSLDIGIAASFADLCCVYEIHVPKNTPMLYIESITKVSGEQEVLLPFGCTFKINGKRTQELKGGFEKHMHHEIYVCELIGYEKDVVFNYDDLSINDLTVAKILAPLKIGIQTFNAVKKYYKVEEYNTKLKEIIDEKLEETLKFTFSNIIEKNKAIDIILRSIDTYSELIDIDLLQSILESLREGAGTGVGAARKNRRRTHRRKNRKL